jgi:hypothetical protein
VDAAREPTSDVVFEVEKLAATSHEPPLARSVVGLPSGEREPLMVDSCSALVKGTLVPAGTFAFEAAETILSCRIKTDLHGSAKMM